MNSKEEFTCELTQHVAILKTREQMVFVRRELLRDAFFSLKESENGSCLSIITKGPAYNLEIPESLDELSEKITSLIADLG